MRAPAGRRAPEVVPVVLGAAILATVVAMVVLVLSHPAPPVRASAAGSPTTAAPEFPVEGTRGRTVAAVVADLEVAGAHVQTKASRGEGTVGDDWVVCRANPIRRGDTPTGTVSVTARPPGALCA